MSCRSIFYNWFSYFSGNYLEKLSRPYKRGKPCSGCPDHCRLSKLCTNSCPAADLWANCGELYDTWPQVLCSDWISNLNIDIQIASPLSMTWYYRSQNIEFSKLSIQTFTFQRKVKKTSIIHEIVKENVGLHLPKTANTKDFKSFFYQSTL